MSFANIIIANRMIRHMSLRDLERISGVAHERISKYERGIDSPTDIHLHKIMASMEVVLDETISHQLDKLYSQFVDCLFFLTPNRQVFLEDIDKNLFHYLSCSSCAKALIIRFACHVYDEEAEKCGRDIKLINKLILNDEEKQMYFHCLGIYYDDQCNFEEAEKHYNQSLIIRSDERIYAMNRYFYGMLLSSNYDLKYSEENLKEAKRIFFEYTNFKRIAFCDMVLGNVYLNQKEYDKSLISYRSTLRTYDILNIDPSQKFSVKKNIALLYLQKEEYGEALKLFDELFELKPKDSSIIIFYCYCAYQMKNSEMLKKWVKYGSKYISKENYNDLQYLRLFKAIIQSPNSKNTLNTAISAYNNLLEKTTSVSLCSILTIIIEIAVQRDDYRTAYLYQLEKEKLQNPKKV